MAGEIEEAAAEIAHLVLADGRLVAVAESLTGGELSAKLACAPDAGEWFAGGLVAYSSDVKRSVLGVPDGPVVSQIAVEAMASGIVRLLDADVGIAVSGVAGPDAQDGQPPGTVWFAIHALGVTESRLEHLAGDPNTVVDATTTRALEWLKDSPHHRIALLSRAHVVSQRPLLENSLLHGLDKSLFRR